MVRSDIYNNKSANGIVITIMSTVAHTVWVNPVNFNPISKSIMSLITMHTHTHKTTY